MNKKGGDRGTDATLQESILYDQSTSLRKALILPVDIIALENFHVSDVS